MLRYAGPQRHNPTRAGATHEVEQFMDTERDTKALNLLQDQRSHQPATAVDAQDAQRWGCFWWSGSPSTI